jgi:hypothetical protein
MDAPCFVEVATTECMVRCCFAIGAVLVVYHNIIYFGLRFSILGIKVDNGELKRERRLYDSGIRD